MGNDSVCGHLFGLPDGGTGMINRRRRHALRGQPVQSANTRPIQTHAGIVKDDRAQAGPTRQKGSIHPAMRSGDGNPALGRVPQFCDTVRKDRIVRQPDPLS